MTYPALRFDRLQLAFFTAGRRIVDAGVVDECAWSFGHVPYQQNPAAPPASLLRLEMLNGPSVGNVIHGSGSRLWKPPNTVTVRVTAATAGERVWMRLNGFELWYDVQPGDTTADIRDALISLVNDAEPGRVTATVLTATDLQLAATSFGNLWSLEFRTGVSTLIAGDGVFTDRAVKVRDGEHPGTVTFQAFSKSRELATGATSILFEALAELHEVSLVHELSRLGVALRDRGTTVPIPAARGSVWESRAACDVGFTMRGHNVREVGLIERASVAVDILQAPGASPFTTSADAQP